MRVSGKPVLQEQINFKEWSTGSTWTVLEKTLAVISRRIGKKTYPSPFADVIKNEYGTFLAYTVGLGGGKKFRVNFKQGGNQNTFYSIDLWHNFAKLNPDETLMINGYNIVQVIGQICEFLNDDLAEEEANMTVNVRPGNKVTEKVGSLTLPEFAIDLVKKDPAYFKLATTKGVTGDQLEVAFNNALKAAGASKTVNARWAAFHTKNALKALGQGAVASSVPVATVVAPPSRTVTFADLEEQRMYEASESNSPFVFMEMFEKAVQRICELDPEISGCLAYGKAGVGKDFTVDKIVEQTGAPFIKLGGALGKGGKTGFLQVLYENRDGKVLIFSDLDMIWDDDNMLNILKIVLDIGAVRKVSIGTEIKLGAGQNADVIPADFDFSSKIIFLSNKTDLDTNPKFAAHMSRLAGQVFPLLFTEADTLLYIKAQMSGIKTAGGQTVSDDIKMEVYEYCQRLVNALSAAGKGDRVTVDFRRFRKALGERAACPPETPKAWIMMTNIIFRSGVV